MTDETLSRREADSHLTQVIKLVRDTNSRTIIIDERLKEINGTVSRHNEELFGNQHTVGVVRELEEIHDFMVSTKSGIKIMITLLSAVGIGNVLLLISLVSKIGETN